MKHADGVSPLRVHFLYFVQITLQKNRKKWVQQWETQIDALCTGFKTIGDVDYFIFVISLRLPFLFLYFLMSPLSMGYVNTEGLCVKRGLLNLFCLICLLSLSLSLFPLEICVTFQLIAFTVRPHIQFGSAISINAVKSSLRNVCQKDYVWTGQSKLWLWFYFVSRPNRKSLRLKSSNGLFCAGVKHGRLLQGRT
jgi:hypothetical protein